MIEKLSGWIAHHPKTILIAATLLLIPAVIGFVTTRVNYDILTYLPENLDSVKGEQILDETFNDAAVAVITIEQYNAYDTAQLEQSIAAIDGVQQVLWTDSLFDISIPQSMLPDAVNQIFYSEKNNSTMMIVRFTEQSASERTMNAIGEIRKVMAKNCFMSGLSVIGVDTKNLVEGEAPLYSAVAVLLALCVLLASMNSFVLPFLVLFSLGYAVLYNMGTNLAFGEISYITQSIAAILQLGVTMDYSVFLIDRFSEEKEKFSDKKDAMASAIKSTFVSITGSSLTTAFGFLSLCFMSFTLGLDLGLVMTKGVLFGILSVLTVLPSFILLFHKAVEKTTHRDIKPNFDRLNGFFIRHKRVFAVIFLLLFIPAIYMANHVKLYYNMMRALPEETESVVALEKMKENFNMATTHFIIVDEDMSASDLADMTAELEQVDGITGVMGVGSFVGGLIPYSVLPDAVRDLCVRDGYQLMMANTSYTAATDEENAQIEQMQEIVKKYDSGGLMTGEGVLTKDLVEVTSRDFKVTNIISIAAIFVLIAICFKSVSIPLILVAAIELAIMLNESVSYLLGTELVFVAPTIISCVQLGATVDYAILLTSRFKEELSRCPDRDRAMRKAANGACVSILQSSLVFFAATFGVWCLSDMEIVKSICALLARGALISGFVIVCFLGPVLLCCEKVIAKTSWGWRGKGEESKGESLS